MFRVLFVSFVFSKSPKVNNFIAEVNCDCWEENKVELQQQISSEGLKINGETNLAGLCFRYISGRKTDIEKLECVTLVDLDGEVGINSNLLSK